MEQDPLHKNNNGSGSIIAKAPSVNGNGYVFLFIYAVHGEVRFGYPEINGVGVVEKEKE